MGAPSLAAMLLIRVGNAFTGGFARPEILGRVGIPVFFGAVASTTPVAKDDVDSWAAAAGPERLACVPLMCPIWASSLRSESD
ncbi:hypothetical protein [Falsiroseomonas sp.]|uniref:hypothetical protein n=1 Tax=Falsiroseomonas sp. TaxID=2870721 RepID=UPI0027361E8A|nr:hypothetical protein [Falsiroseomonas sp.]MDP3418488.1 hypothetical protein [Falsiroseomonas sp.]